MKIVFLFASLLMLTISINAQEKYFTKTGKIKFNATAPASPEKIEGLNKSAACVLDTKTGNIQFVVLMKGFEFERALMQEHFNENYAESTQYPKAEFKGSVVNNSTIIYSKEGVYPAKVSGKLTMHGITKEVQADGKITIKNGKIMAMANFKVTLADYGIAVPALVADKVARTANIEVDCSLEPLNK